MSTDGGETWTNASSGLPEGNCGLVSNLAVDRHAPDTIYAGIWPGGDGCATEAGVRPRSSAGGLWKTVDGGKNWSQVSSAPAGGGFRGVVLEGQTLYAWNARAISRSTDQGATWDVLTPPNLSSFIYAVVVDPQIPARMYALTDVGAFGSVDAGATWVAISTGLPSIGVTSLAIDPNNPATLYAAIERLGVFRSTDAGATWHGVNSGLTSLAVQRIVFDPQSRAVYAATAGGVFVARFDQ